MHTIDLQKIFAEQMKLKLFPLSLRDQAKIWLHSLRPNSIGRWDEMQKFPKKPFQVHQINYVGS